MRKICKKYAKKYARNMQNMQKKIRTICKQIGSCWLLSLPINAFWFVGRTGRWPLILKRWPNVEMAVDSSLRLTPGFGPGPQAVTPFSQTMRCPASVVMPPSSYPPQRSNRLEALVCTHPSSWNFLGHLMVFWIVGRRVLSLQRVKKGHKRRAAMKEEIKEIDHFFSRSDQIWPLRGRLRSPAALRRLHQTSGPWTRKIK